MCIRRINPVYAAYAIERSKPTLKNSLINFLLLRAQPTGLAPHVYEAIEQHAATQLAEVPVEATVDRSKLIKIGYVFLGLVLAAAIYKVSSPKDPFLTFGRIVLPWADIAPPTRVTIVDVRPGNGTVMRGQRAKISAEVHGVARQQTVKLVYSTDDGQIVDRSVPMQVPTEGYLFECELPEGKGGIQQDVTYRVVAGDANSNEFHLVVQAAPTIVVESVDYVYPGYTGMVSQTVDHQGDLKAIEGTQITLHAVANQPIKSAAIDFDCNGSDDQRMTFDDRHATATFTLALKADHQTPEHTSYQLRFTNTDGKENPQPIRHQIEVTRDVAPEIQFLAPKRDEIDLPVNRGLVCEVSAHDPDFALSRVAIVGKSSAGQPFERSLLDEPAKTGQPWQGQFRKKLVLVPQKLGLKAGDVLEYWAWAEDDKTPVANHTETIHRQLRIISASEADASSEALASSDQQSDKQPSHDPSAEDKEPGSKSDSPEAEPPSDDHAESPKAGADHARPQNPRRDGDKPPGANPKDEMEGGKAESMPDSPAGDQDRDQADQQPENQEQGGGESADGKQSGKEQAGKGKSGKGQSGKNSGGQEETGQGESGQGKSGEGESGDSSSADTSQGDKGESGQPGARGKPGSDRARGAKRQPVAQDGSEDGEAFEEIIERQDEQEQAGSGSGDRQTATRRSSTPPAHGTPTEQSAGQGSPDEQNGEKGAEEKKPGEKKPGEKKPDGKEPEGKESAGKESTAESDAAGEMGKKDADKEGADKKGANKKPVDGSGADAEGETAADEHPTGDKPTAGKSSPDGKPMNQSGDEEKSASDADGRSTSDARSQAKSGQPGKGKQTPDKQEPAEEGEGQPASGQSPTGTKPEKKQTPQNGASKGSQDHPGRGAEEPTADQPEGTKSGHDARSPGKSGQKPLEKPSGKGKPEGKPGEGPEDQGDSGAGQNGADDKQGSPQQSGQNRPTKKPSGHENKPDGQRDKSGSPPSPSGSDHQSDSEGEQDGDRSGGGKRGGGQKSQQAGAGEPGSHTEGDEGGEAGADQGGQEMSDEPGGDREAEKPTGQPGQSAGSGSSAGAPPPGDRSKPAVGQGKDKSKPASNAGPGQSPSGNSGKQGPGQGKGNTTQSEPVEPPPAPEQADEANLEFTRKATELTIQRLRDQLTKGQVDQELLDRLQWSQQDMDRWVSRWEEMFRRSAKQGKDGQTARMELDGALRSLGLSPHGSEVSAHRHDDTASGLKEGRRTRPPAEYRDLVRQYMQGISRTQNGATTGRGAQPPRQATPAGTEK